MNRIRSIVCVLCVLSFSRALYCQVDYESQYRLYRVLARSKGLRAVSAIEVQDSSTNTLVQTYSLSGSQLKEDICTTKGSTSSRVLRYFDDWDSLVQETQYNQYGRTSSYFTYDASHRISSKIIGYSYDPQTPTITRYLYDSLGRLRSLWTKRTQSEITNFYRDQHGYIIAADRSVNGILHYSSVLTYDSLGRVNTETDYFCDSIKKPMGGELYDYRDSGMYRCTTVHTYYDSISTGFVSRIFTVDTLRHLTTYELSIVGDTVESWVSYDPKTHHLSYIIKTRYAPDDDEDYDDDNDTDSSNDSTSDPSPVVNNPPLPPLIYKADIITDERGLWQSMEEKENDVLKRKTKFTYSFQ